MLKNLLRESKDLLDYFFESVDLKQFEHILKLCATCKGMLIFTGVGKSGTIAEKIANTLASTGTKALYLPTLNFLHGDIGILSEGDIVFMLSKSGEAEDLLNLLPFIERKKTTTVSITSAPNSRLAKDCTDHMFLPIKKELCHFDLVPTTSSEVQLIFGNILSIALMKTKNFSLTDYALNHPSGSIGKKMTLFVKDLMLSGEHLPLCSKESKLSDVLLELTQKRCGALVVANENKKLEGIFTDGDLRRALQRHGSDILSHKIQDLMTTGAISIDLNALAWDAMKEMQKDPNKWIMVTPVTEKGQVVGLLRMHDIIQSGIS
jgi:arabinose-5-phosphate isomerase